MEHCPTLMGLPREVRLEILKYATDFPRVESMAWAELVSLNNKWHCAMEDVAFRSLCIVASTVENRTLAYEMRELARARIDQAAVCKEQMKEIAEASRSEIGPRPIVNRTPNNVEAMIDKTAAELELYFDWQQEEARSHLHSLTVALHEKRFGFAMQMERCFAKLKG